MEGAIDHLSSSSSSAIEIAVAEKALVIDQIENKAVEADIIFVDDEQKAGADIFKYTVPSRSEDVYNKFAYFLMGVALLYGWNALINCVNSTNTFLFPNISDLSDQSTALFDCVGFLFCLVVVYFGSLKKFWVYAGLITTCIACFGWMAASLWMSDDATAHAVLDISAVLAGIGCSLAQSASFAYSLAYGKVYADWLNFGIGASTVISLGVWSLLSEVIFTGDDPIKNTRSSLIVHLAFAMALQVCAMISMEIMFRGKLFSVWLEESKIRAATIVCDGDVVGYWEGFKKTWHWQLHQCIGMGVGFMTFPNILPLEFHETVSQTNWAMGANQIGQFCGRLLPVFAFVIPWVMLPKRLLRILDWGHFILFGLSLAVMYSSPDTPILGDYWFHIILAVSLGITMAWYPTLCSIYLPDCFERAEDKGRVSSIGTMLFTGSIALGLALDQLWIHI